MSIRTVVAFLGAWSLASVAGSSTAATSKEILRDQLARVARDTRTASWIHDSWETKDGKTEESRARCFWTRDGRFRMEVIDGRGAGSTLVLDGDRVTVRPFGIFGLLRLHYKVTDDAVRSVRGNELTHTSFIDDISVMLDSWDKADVAISGPEATVSYLDRQHQATRAWIRLAPLELERVETTEGGRLVQKTIYEQIRVGDPLDPKLFQL